MNKFLALNTLLNQKCINNNVHKFSILGYYIQKYEPADLVFKTSCIFLTQNLGIFFTVLSSISDELQSSTLTL